MARPLDEIRSDLRGQAGLAISPLGVAKFHLLLAEAHAVASPEQWKNLKRELSLHPSHVTAIE